MRQRRGWAFLCCRVCLVRFGVLLDGLLYDHLRMGAEFGFLFDVFFGNAYKLGTTQAALLV